MATDDPTAPQPLTADPLGAERISEIKAAIERGSAGVRRKGVLLGLVATVEQLQAEVDRLTAELDALRGFMRSQRGANDD